MIVVDKSSREEDMTIPPDIGLMCVKSLLTQMNQYGVGGLRSLLICLLSTAFCANLHAETKIILPGTQPNEHNFQFRDVKNCAMCHSETPNGKNDPFFSWQGGMMAQAARDPVFRAALAIANQDLPGSGEFCIRCHAPRAWLEGASAVTDGSSLTNDYLNGVSCDVCHHMVNPLSEEAKKLAKQTPVDLGNGGFVEDFERIMRGPYNEPKGFPMHVMTRSDFHASSELCGACHNVSNPTLATNVFTQPPHAYGHIERTYSEWALSDFAKSGSLRTCQSCHFPSVPGGGMATRHNSNYGDRHRDHFVSHNAVGGSTWVQDAVCRIWKGKDLDRDAREALEVGKENARALLKSAVALGLEIANDKARLTITNLTGHKFPTGYPEGRRSWVNVRCYKSTNLLEEVGRYGDIVVRLQLDDDRKVKACGCKAGSTILKRIQDESQFKVSTLLDPEHTRVYECKPGLSAKQAAKYKKRAGPSFHFILNDVITKDNRIPPQGYSKAAFAEHLAAPVDTPRRRSPPLGTPIQPLWDSRPATNPSPRLNLTVASPAPDGYADGQFWDDLEFELPAGADLVEVRLMYQSVSWEYLKFLVEKNRTDCWGLKLLDAWDTTGRCPPEEIAFITRAVRR